MKLSSCLGAKISPLRRKTRSFKGRVAKRNNFKWKDLEGLEREGFSEVDQMKWAACVRHTVGIEDQYWATDKVQDQIVIPPVVINLGESDSE